MSRQLTALEKYRITGVYDAEGQIAAFEHLGIPATARLSVGAIVIECVVHTDEVRACMDTKHWLEISDENIGTGGRWFRPVQSTRDKCQQNPDSACQDSTDSAELIDQNRYIEYSEEERRQA